MAGNGGFCFGVWAGSGSGLGIDRADFAGIAGAVAGDFAGDAGVDGVVVGAVSGGSALREQNMLARLDADLPVYAPPSFWAYFAGKLRMQMLLPIIPILMIVGFRDTARMGLRLVGVNSNEGGIDLLISAIATGSVFVMAPEVLRRVLWTERLEDPVLRERLAAVVERAGVRYRDVLLWRTHQTVGNAMVMGLCRGSGMCYCRMCCWNR